MFQANSVFKVVSPMERKDGGKYWMRLGNAYVNKDNSINVYLDAVPLGQQRVTLQLRELTADELRERAEKRSTYTARGSLGAGGFGAGGFGAGAGSVGAGGFGAGEVGATPMTPGARPGASRPGASSELTEDGVPF